MSGFWLDDEDDTQQRWTLAQIYADLGTYVDVCKALNIGEPRMRKWLERRERIKCPQPIRKIGGTAVYSIEEWRGWLERWQAKNLRNNPTSKWVVTKPHGSGKPFFTYDNPEL